MARRPAAAPRRKTTHRPEGPERLELRRLMADDAFAVVRGDIVPGATAEVTLRVLPESFDLPRGVAILGLGLHADGDATLDPGRIATTPGAGGLPRLLTSRPDADGGTSARALVATRTGALPLALNGERGTGGAFRLDVTLAGDVDGDGRVTAADLRGVRDRLGDRGADLGPADVDGDGRVAARDWWITRFNLGAATDLRPLDLELGLDPADDPDGDGRVAAGAPARLIGTTRPDAAIRVDVGGDGTVEHTAVADASGSFRITLDPASGTLPLRVEAADGFGQRAVVAHTVTWLDPNAGPRRNLDVAVGATLAATIRPGGLEGAGVTYTITPQPLPDHLTFDRGSGALRFVPDPGQAGVLEFRIVADDGSRTAAQALTLRVAPAAEATAVLSGLLVDEAGVPLAGVPVRFGALSVASDAAGVFRIDGVPADAVGPLVLDGAGGGRLTAMAPADQLLGHPVYATADNAIPTPLVLPRLDLEHAVDFATLDPASAHDLTSPLLPGVVLHVPAGAAVDGQGRPFAGLLSLTPLVVEQMTPFLPPGTNPGVMIGVDGPDLHFATPARITLPNTAGHRPGETFDLLAMNPTTGAFQDSGTLRVSDDGLRLETIAGGLTASSCISLSGLGIGVTGEFDLCKGCQTGANGATAPGAGPSGDLYGPRAWGNGGGMSSSGGGTSAGGGSGSPYAPIAWGPMRSDAGLATGEFFEDHSLAPYQSQGLARGLVLEYSSLQADPRPLIHLDSSLQYISQTPHTIKATAELGGVGQGAAVSYTTAGTGLFFGGHYRVPVQVDATALDNGLYPYEIDITHVYGVEPWVEKTSTVAGLLGVVNTSDGPYGAGWSVGGLQHIHAASASSSALVTQGAQGTERYGYRPPGPIQDLAVVVGGNARLLRNDGAGKFTLATPSRAVPNGAVDMAAGDFDGDGLADLVVASASTSAHGHQVALLTADGADGFDAAVATALSAKPVALLAGRFNAGTTLDLVAHLADGTVAILPGNGSGGFGTAVVTTVGGGAAASTAGPGTMAAGDFDGDGDTDLVVSANGDNKLRILLNNGSGSFSATAYTLPTAPGGIGGHAGQVAVGDLTGDGDLDLAVAHSNSNSVLSMLVGDGSGSFSHSSIINAFSSFEHASRIAIGDFYGGGQAAAAVWFRDPGASTGGTSGASIIPGSTSGTWQQETSVFYDNDGGNLIVTNGLAAADFNGDGRPDMAAVDGYGAPRLLTSNPDLNQLNEVREIAGGAATLVAAAPFTGRTQVARYVGPASDPSVLVRNANGTWRRSYPDGTVLDFGADGRLATQTDRNGNATAYSYVTSGAATGALKTIVDPVGLRTTLAYDAAGKLRTVTDPAGRVTTFTVNAGGDLTQVVDPDGAVSQYGYQGHRITGQVDPRGNATTVTYDGFGRFVSESLPGALGTVTVVAGETVGLLAPGGSGTLPMPATYRGTVTDPNGRTATLSFDTMSHPTSALNAQGKQTSYTYNERGRVATATDPLSRTTAFEYDERGNVTKLTRHDGTYTEIAYDPQFSRPTRVRDFRGNVTTYALDAKGNVTRRTDPDLGYEDVTYKLDGQPATATDRGGRTTTFAYDIRGRLTTITYPGTGTPQTKIAYSTAGDPTRVTDELGHAVTFTYDNAGRLKTAQDPAQAAAGKRTTFTYDPSGNPTRIEDANGHATTFAYDARDRLVAVTEPVHQGTGKRTTLVYDGMNLVGVVDPLSHGVTYAYDEVNRLTKTVDALGNTTTYVYDNAGQLQSVIDPRNNRTTFTYDAVGRLKSETLPGTLPGPWGYPTAVVTNYAYDGNGNLTSVTDPLGHATATTFDTLNRPVAVARQADWSTTLRTTFTYDAVGNRTVVQDGLDHRTTVAYDVRNRPVAETRPAGGGTTTFTYDLAGRLTGVKDPVGNLTSYTYDTADRLTVATDPLGKRTTHAYDPVGNRTTTTDRLGRIRQFAYDADDRLVTEAWKPVGGGATIRTVTWTYDDAGRLTAVKDPDSQYAYAYDNADRLTGVDNAGSPGMPSVALTYAYDPAGNRTAVQDSLGGLTSYAYDVRNWLTDITQSGTGVAAKRVDFAYDAAGRRTGLTRFSDLAGTATVLVTANTYDDADRLTNLTHKTAGGTTRASYGYTLDAAGRLTGEARTWTTSGGTASDTVGYGYTNDDQLTGVTHSNGSFAAESFGYDANGNRNTAGYGTTTGNRLAAAPGFTYAHDAEGNRTSVTETATGKITTYAYDHRDRMTGATIKDASGSVLARTTYTYDALDRRIKVAAGANVLKVVYDGPAVILDFNGGNAEVARYLQGPAIDEVLARETGTGNTVAWYLQDRLGTVRDIANNSGAIVDHLGYDAFGAVTIETDPGYGDRFKFTGRELDPVTGLQFNRARWYDAAAGRFLSEDPIGFGGGDANLYRYVGNRPAIATDPTGLSGEDNDEPIPEHGGPNDVPASLPGRWEVSIISGGDHAWMRYKNVDTGVVCSAGRYPDQVAGVNASGVQWNREARMREEGLEGGLRRGDYVKRSRIIENPKIYLGGGVDGAFGYDLWYNNCTTYACWAWYETTGEWLDQRPGPFCNPLPDLPTQLRSSIRNANNKDSLFWEMRRKTMFAIGY